MTILVVSRSPAAKTARVARPGSVGPGGDIANNDEAGSSSNVSGKKRAATELDEVKETVRGLSTKVANLLEAQAKLLEALAKK